MSGPAAPFAFEMVRRAPSQRTAGLITGMSGYRETALGRISQRETASLVVPLIMPAPLFRVLFVGYWLWGNVVPPDMMPTLSGSLLHPIGGYPLDALLDFHGIDGKDTVAGPVPGAALNFLRPDSTPLTAWLSIGVLLVLAAAALAAANALRARRAR